MRACYESFYEFCLIAAMARECPRFAFMDAAARRKFGVLSFYGPGKLSGFSWSPLAALTFIIVFRAPLGKDSFEASCEWTETGKVVKEQALVLDSTNDNEALRGPHGRTLMQSLSVAAGDPPDRRVVFWNFWTPTANPDDVELWFKQTIDNETRMLSDVEANERVVSAVDKAVADIKRLAVPWCERKLKLSRGPFKLSVQGETLLRYLASPRSVQRPYASRGTTMYGYEGRDSYGRAADGLPLLLLVGEDCLAHDVHRLHDQDLQKSLFLVNSLVRFIIEAGDDMTMIMEIDDDDADWHYTSGVWQLLRQLASAFLEQIGAQTGPPVLSYHEVFLPLCLAVPAAGV